MGKKNMSRKIEIPAGVLREIVLIVSMQIVMI